MAFDQSTYKCFATSTCIAIAEGLPPSPKEHCLDFYQKSSSIQDTLCDKLFALLAMKITFPAVIIWLEQPHYNGKVIFVYNNRRAPA